MAIRVQIPTPMRQHTENLTTVEAAGATVKALLDKLLATFADLQLRLVLNGQARR